MNNENKLSRVEIAHLFSKLFKIIVLEESKYIESYLPAEYTATIKEKEEIISTLTNTFPTIFAINYSITKLTVIAKIMIKNVTSSYGLTDYKEIIKLDKNQYNMYFESYITVYERGVMSIVMGSLYLLNQLRSNVGVLYTVWLGVYTDDAVTIENAYDMDKDKLKELYDGIQ